MGRLIISLLILHTFSYLGTTTRSAVIRRVRAGDTVFLPCDHKHQTETVWHGQHIGEVPFIILSASRDSPHKQIYHWGYKGNFSIDYNENNKSFTLVITNITSSDLGLFYCITNTGAKTLVGSGTQLTFDGDNLPTSTPASSSSSPTQSQYPETCPSSTGVYWALAAILVLLVPLCVYVICCTQRLIKSTTSQKDQDRNEAKTEGADNEVIYTTVHITQEDKMLTTRRGQ